MVAYEFYLRSGKGNKLIGILPERKKSKENDSRTHHELGKKSWVTKFFSSFGGLFVTMGLTSFLLVLTCFFSGAISFAWGRTQPLPEVIAAEVENSNGEELEKHLYFDFNEPSAPTKDDQEAPPRTIEWVKLEKIQRGLPGADLMKGEGYYSLRLQDRRKIFTLNEKYDFNLVTSVGIIAKTSSQMVRDLLGKDPSSGGKFGDGQSLIQDKGVTIGLEIKF